MRPRGIPRWDEEIGVVVHPLPSRTAAPKLYRACLFLYRELARSTPALWPPWGEPQAMPAGLLIFDARAEGISERTLREAKKLCLVDDSRDDFGPGSVCYWLPPRRVFVRWVKPKPELTRLEYQLPKKELLARRRADPGARHDREMKWVWGVRATPPRPGRLPGLRLNPPPGWDHPRPKPDDIHPLQVQMDLGPHTPPRRGHPLGAFPALWSPQAAS